MSLLSVKNLSVSFQTRHGPFQAVKGISFAVDKGEIFTIVGESGSGKSVAMMALMGLLPKTATITADEIFVNGLDYQIRANQRAMIGKNIAMIFQDPLASLNPCFTIGYQIAESLMFNKGLDKKSARGRVIELLTMVGMTDPERRFDAYPHQLSGGMCQRVGIAMSLAVEPQLLIADEPTTALDVTIQAQILKLLQELQAKTQMGLIFITHDMGVVAQISQRVMVMYAGHCVELQGARQFFTHPYHPYSRALLQSMPEHAVNGRLSAIGGVVPGVHDQIHGCIFNPRCAFSDALCQSQKPPIQGQFGHSLCHKPIMEPLP